MILLQAYQVGLAALQELLDMDFEPALTSEMRPVVASLTDEAPPLQISSVSNLIRFRSGPNKIVQVDLIVRPEITVAQTTKIEAEVQARLKDRFEDVTEIKVRFRPMVK